MTNILTNLTKRLKTGINTIVVNDLPDDVSAMVTKNLDESYTITLNGSFGLEQLKKAYLHELKHIEDNHFALLADEAEKLVRRTEEPTLFGMPASEYAAMCRRNYLRRKKRRRKKPLPPDPEADYYPPGAYEEMKQRGWI